MAKQRLVITYCIDQGEDSDAKPVELVSAAEYCNLDTAAAYTLMDNVTAYIEEELDHFAEVALAHEAEAFEADARILLEELEEALAKFVAT
jgi:hypothetical protein